MRIASQGGCEPPNPTAATPQRQRPLRTATTTTTPAASRRTFSLPVAARTASVKSRTTCGRPSRASASRAAAGGSTCWPTMAETLTWSYKSPLPTTRLDVTPLSGATPCWPRVAAARVAGVAGCDAMPDADAPPGTWARRCTLPRCAFSTTPPGDDAGATEPKRCSKSFRMRARFRGPGPLPRLPDPAVPRCLPFLRPPFAFSFFPFPCLPPAAVAPAAIMLLAPGTGPRAGDGAAWGLWGEWGSEGCGRWVCKWGRFCGHGPPPDLLHEKCGLSLQYDFELPRLARRANTEAARQQAL